MAFVATGFVDFFRQCPVLRAVGAVEIIEGYLKAGKVSFVLGFYTVDQLFGCDAFFFGAQHDGGAMSIVGTNVITLVATGFLETDPDVRLNVFQHMPHVDRAIGIGKGAGYQNFTRVLCGHDNSLRLLRERRAAL